ncbi:MAG: hypothetical protein KDK70_37075 [Myxococcales bacterium]|nr:hypothetical protein [Myxococcales bacterium]
MGRTRELGAAVAGDMAATRREIDAWRAQKRGGEAMPAALWDAAVGLVGDASVYDVSRELGVDYGKLKRLVGDADGRAVAAAPEFIELAGLFEGHSAAIVEMRRPDGASIRLELPDGSFDVVGLASTFFRAEA